MSIASQNWDGVTPPSLPSGWNFGTASMVTTTSLPGSLSPISTPNVLYYPGTSNTNYFAIYETSDGNSGNVVVSGYFAIGSYSTRISCGLVARCSTTAPTTTSGSYYWFDVSFDAGTVSLIASVSGSPTSLGTVTFDQSVNKWYQFFLACNGTSISCAMYDVALGNWLYPTGNFGPGQVNVISVTDSSVTGAGYSGFSMLSHSDTPYTDSWLLSAASVVTPAPPPLVVNVPFQFWPQYAE